MFFFSGKENPLNDMIVAAGLSERRVCACMYLAQRLSITNVSNLRACVRESRREKLYLSTQRTNARGNTMLCVALGKEIKKESATRATGGQKLCFEVIYIIVFQTSVRHSLAIPDMFFFISACHLSTRNRCIANWHHAIKMRWQEVADNCQHNQMQCEIRAGHDRICSDWRYFRWHGKIN